MIISMSFLLSLLTKVLATDYWPLRNGKYTKLIKDYELSVPHKVNSIGGFESFHLPTYFDYDLNYNKRKKRYIEDIDTVRYSVRLDGKDYQINLWPNQDFLLPTTSFENYDSTIHPSKREIRGIYQKKLCYYTGKIKGIKDSSVALSTCNGLVGTIRFNQRVYYVEPVEGHIENDEGHLLHIVHKPIETENNENENEVRNEADCLLNTDDWRDGWKNAFRDQMINEREKRVGQLYENEHYERNLSQFNISLRHAEILLVGDKMFVEQYKTIDVDEFILTVMNLVNDAYHDYTIGVPFEVYLKRVILLDKEEAETEIKIGTDATDYLVTFCSWVEKLRGKEGDPNHFDAAVIFTGRDICAPSQHGGAACGVTGRAEIARFCVKDHSCLIAEAKGIASAVTISHEMGHLLGCDHDGVAGSMCASHLDEVRNDSTPYIMAGKAGPYSYSWSPCSRAFIRNFLASGIPTCLDNEPEKVKYVYKNILPGVMYDMDLQCLWGAGRFNATKFCPAMTNNEKLCQVYYCKRDSNPAQCIKWDRGALDGTKCGEDKWCIERKCIPKGSRGNAINGGWGDWSAWSECSRTCGGGIREMERECDKPIPSNGGMYCVGEKKKYEICNKQPCKDRVSFKTHQCQKVGPNWLPCGIPGYLPCWLHCYDTTSPKGKCKDKSRGVEIIDGTPCKGGTKNRCIDGVCINIGCDWKIHSTKQDDVCGICGGDGTSCKVAKGEEDGKKNGIGRWKLVTVPKGSRKVEVWSSKFDTKSSISVTDASGKNIYLHPNPKQSYAVSADEGEKQFGKDIGYLTYRPAERIHVEGPTLEDLTFFINCNNPAVTYSYRFAVNEPDEDYKTSYHWDVTEFSDCSAKCGGGVRSPVLRCVEAKAGVVGEEFCKDIEKQKTEPSKCNEQPCKKEWRVGKWSKCQACRFRTGTRKREVECIQENPDPEKGDVILLEDEKCDGPRPGHHQLCVTNEECKEAKRHIDDFPDEAMEDVWQQIYKNSLNKRNTVN